MPVVDIHAHIYPEKIAERAVEAIGEFYMLKMKGEGTAEKLLAAAEGTPITHFVVHSVATAEKSVETINTFIASECEKHPEFIGFATMHHEYADPILELERAQALGLCGVKLHPDTQQVDMDDPRLMDVYEFMEAIGMPLIVHAGDYRYDYSSPERLINVLKTFPKLRVNAAHMGGWSIHDVAVEYLEHENCFVDCSSSMAFMGDRRMRELVEIYGADRVLFGSDFPMWDPKSEFERFNALGFSEEEYEKMYWKNAERFLGFEIE